MFDDSCKQYWDHASHVMFDQAIAAWCDGSPGCMEAKKHALLTKLEEDVVGHRRADGKTYRDTVYKLAADRNLLVDKVSFVEWASSVSDTGESENLQKNLAISSRATNANLSIIGALVDIFFEKSPGGQPYSNIASQADLIDKVVLKHGHIDGISKRTLEGKFSEAKKHLKSM